MVLWWEISLTTAAWEPWAPWGLPEREDTTIHSTIDGQGPLRTRWCLRWEASKPRCLLHWLQEIAARLMEDAWWQPRQEWKSPGLFLSLNSNPGSSFTWEDILDPVLWQLWPSMFLSQMRLRFFKDPFSLKYSWICGSHYTQIAMECWTAFTWNNWSLTELCWVQCIFNICQRYNEDIL